MNAEVAELFDDAVAINLMDEVRQSKRRTRQRWNERPGRPINPFALNRKVVSNGGRLILNRPTRILIPCRDGINTCQILAKAGWADINPKHNSTNVLATAPAGTVVSRRYRRLVFETFGCIPFALHLERRNRRITGWKLMPFEAEVPGMARKIK